MLSASFRHQLMLNDTIGIFFSLGIAFVEVVQGKRTSIGGFGHVNGNYIFKNQYKTTNLRMIYKPKFNFQTKNQSKISKIYIISHTNIISLYFQLLLQNTFAKRISNSKNQIKLKQKEKLLYKILIKQLKKTFQQLFLFSNLSPFISFIQVTKIKSIQLHPTQTESIIFSIIIIKSSLKVTMYQSKNSISTNYNKRKDQQGITPFEAYSSFNKQKNVPGFFLTSSRKKMNKSLFDSNQQPISSNNLCLKHSLNLNSLCFTCNFQLMCQQCIKSTHPLTTNTQHDIRSLQKSSSYIKNLLIQTQIKLQAKSNILTNINQQLNSQKIQLYTQKKTYKQELERNFKYIHELLDEKLNQMKEQIQYIYEENDKQFAVTIQQIKNLQKYYEKCQQNINHTLQTSHQSNNDFTMCQFYINKKQQYQQIIKQTQLKQLKKHIYEIKYKIENCQLDSIIKEIKGIEIGHDFKFIFFDANEQNQSRPESLNNKITKVKSQNVLKIKPSKKNMKKSIKYLEMQNTQKANFIQSRLEKQRQSHKINGTFCVQTPKQNVSREKRFQLLKRSPQIATALIKKRKKSFGKMISMPASPAKQQKQRLSPISKNKQIIQGMKKKVPLTKKKK